MILCSKNTWGRHRPGTWHRQNSSTDSRYFLLNKVELTDGRSVRVQTQKPSKDPEKKKRSTECEETLTHNKPTKQEEHTDLNASGGVNKDQVELMRITRVKGSIERTREGKETSLNSYHYLC